MNFEKEPTPSQSNLGTGNASNVHSILSNIYEYTSNVKAGSRLSENAAKIACDYACHAREVLKNLSESSKDAEAIIELIGLVDKFEELATCNQPLPDDDELLERVSNALNKLNHPSLTKTKERWDELTGVEPTSDSAQIYDFPDQTSSDPQE